MKVIMIKGVHNTGKTTTTTGVISELKKRGYSVGSVKEIQFQDFKIDTEGVDTWLHSQAGASTVTASGINETDIMYNTKLDIESILCHCPEEYVVLEGDPGKRCPNIVTGITTADLDERMDDMTIGFSGIIGEERDEYKGLPVLSNKTDIEKIVDLFEAEIKRLEEENKNQKVELYFDDKEVEILPFVEDIIKGSLEGIVKNLRGYEEGCKVTIKF